MIRPVYWQEWVTVSGVRHTYTHVHMYIYILHLRCEDTILLILPIITTIASERFNTLVFHDDNKCITAMMLHSNYSFRTKDFWKW